MKEYNNWEMVEEGKDLCPRCKVGILERKSSDDIDENIMTCSNCESKFKWRRR